MEMILAIIGVAFAAWCIWALVRVVNQPQRWRTYFGPIGTVTGLVLVAAFFLPAVRYACPAARRTQCLNNLRNIALALHNYHARYDCFPPAYIPDSSGRPMHSWRVLLLPYLDRGDLYDQYRFDEPWDGPNNGKLADKIVNFYACPGGERTPDQDTRTMTSYVAVVGPDTMWPGGGKSTKIADIKDGTANTLMIVEVENSGIHWMEPRDLHVLQMAPTVNAKSGQGISSPHASGAAAALADGRVRFISPDTTAEMIRGLLTINGNEKIGDF